MGYNRRIALLDEFNQDLESIESWNKVLLHQIKLRDERIQSIIERARCAMIDSNINREPVEPEIVEDWLQCIQKKTVDEIFRD